ncbi:MAG TPA: hypothetical protein VKV28_17270 [Candidatus Binataceae bacterium]|nr:hypothetical protein [Candidatus Binataceae bacterium]
MTIDRFTSLLELALLFAVVWERRIRHRTASFPLVPALLLAHVALFGLTTFFYRDELMALMGERTLDYASWLVLAGLSAMVLAYELPLLQLTMPWLPGLSISWRRDPRGTLFIFLAIGLTAATLQTVGVPRTLAGLLMVGVILSFFALSALWLLEFRGELARGWPRPGLWLATALLVGLEMVQGYLATPATYVIVILIAYLHVRRRIPWATLLALVPLLVLLTGIKGVFRQALPGWERASTAAKLEAYALAARSTWDDPALYDQWRALMSRMSDINIFAVVIEQTPREVPYWKGQSYWLLAWSLVPRFLMPGKPLLFADFGQRYGIVARYDDHTAINFPMLVEFYANFGIAGVVIGMFMVGMLCRVLEEMFVDAPYSDAAFALQSALLVQFLWAVELALETSLGALIQHLPVLLAIVALSGLCRIRLRSPFAS